MDFRPFHNRPRRRRIVTMLSLAAYVASVVGYPLPVPAASEAASATSTPYPCQGRGCGCGSAAQCWESCCCHTPAQRLAWAQRHGVALPERVQAELQRAEKKQLAERSTRRAGGCCAPVSACCSSGANEASSHAAGEACAGNDAEALSTEDSSAKGLVLGGVRIGWVDGIAAQKCQGLTVLWLVTGANLPLEIHELWQFDWQLAGYVVLFERSATSPTYEPLVPPPCQPAMA